MGGCFDYRIYDYDDRNKIREDFRECCEQAKYEDGTSYPGTIAAMMGVASFADRAFSTQGEAEEYLNRVHNKWDDAIAVSFMLPVTQTDRDKPALKRRLSSSKLFKQSTVPLDRRLGMILLLARANS
jgi:hypothetical protein